jgi:hypothetical protein
VRAALPLKVLLAAAALAALTAPGAAVAGDGTQRADAKRTAKGERAKRCARPSRGRTRRARCARIRRVARARPAAERLVALRPPLPGAPGGGPGDPGNPGDGTPGPPAARFVSVRALEFSLTLSRPRLDAGAVTIELRNNGEDPHNLIVSPDDGSHDPLVSWADTDPGQILRKSVTLGAGRYQLWCSLLDHEAQGMTVDLVVE